MLKTGDIHPQRGYPFTYPVLQSNGIAKGGFALEYRAIRIPSSGLRVISCCSTLSMPHYSAENGGYPHTQNGDIRSLIQLFRRKELQNETFLQSTELISFHLQFFKLFLVEVLYTWLTNVLNRQHGADEEVRGLFEFRESTVAIELTLIVYEQLATQGGPARPVMPCHRLNVLTFKGCSIN